MKKIKVKVKLTNNLGEESIIDTVGEYNEKKNILSFNDKNVLVRVIINEKIIMQRSHPEYDLRMIFEKNKKHHSNYKIYNPNMDLEIETDTKKLQIKNNGFYVEYMMKLNDMDMGLFIMNFKTEEEL